jgi:hypothetical protein
MLIRENIAPFIARLVRWVKCGVGVEQKPVKWPNGARSVVTVVIKVSDSPFGQREG